MLRIRDDDVLVRSSSWGDPFERFKELHEWIAETEGKVVHVPTVLVREIQEFPDCIAYIKEHTARGTMEPQLHGLTHIDYSRLAFPAEKLPPRGRVKHDGFTAEEITWHERALKAHLGFSRGWMFDEFDQPPTKWYTPWGADNAYLRAAAAWAKLELVGTDNLFEISAACEMFRNGASLEDVEKRGEIMIHWWQRGERVRRVCAAARHGSWAEAVKQEPAIFGE